jgi:hypothetical protein
MIKRTILVVIVGGLLVAGAGCRTMQSAANYPDGGSCSSCGCEGPGMSIFDEPCNSYSTAVFGHRTVACEEECGPCDRTVTGMSRWEHANCRGPFGWFHHLCCWGTCCNGCGEYYCGDWSDPPDACDPCDHYGNWTGRGCRGSGHRGGCGGGSCGSGNGRTSCGCSAGPEVGAPVEDAPGEPIPDDGTARKPGATRIISRTDRVVKPATSDVAQPTKPKAKPKYQTASHVRQVPDDQY